MAITHKLKANTLPEVLIALAIISFASALGVSIYVNIQTSTTPFFKLKANDVCLQELNTSVQQKNYFDNTKSIDEYIVTKRCKRLDEYPDCSTLSITVTDKNGKQLSQIQRIVYAQ